MATPPFVNLSRPTRWAGKRRFLNSLRGNPFCRMTLTRGSSKDGDRSDNFRLLRPLGGNGPDNGNTMSDLSANKDTVESDGAAATPSFWLALKKLGGRVQDWFSIQSTALKVLLI